jgi:Fur family transcriptional regulator, peroxide stress response regulator
MGKDELQEHLSAFEAACRRAGLKLTHQRLEIYRELAASTDHPSAEVLHRRLIKKIPMLAMDTVYRTLRTLSQHGLIHKVETIESQARFEVIFERHQHLICRQCRQVVDFQWPSIDDVLLPDELMHWGKIDSRNVVIYGICNNCSPLKTNDNVDISIDKSAKAD